MARDVIRTNGPGRRSPIAPVSASVRARALQAAAALLAEGGLEAVQIRAIAGRIGCGVATLYHHFEDKNGLLAAVALDGFRQLRADLAAAIDGGRFLRPIDAVSFAYLRFMRRNLALYALMHASQILALHDDVRRAQAETFNAFREALAADARIPPPRVDQVALVCWVLGRGIADAMLAAAAPPTGAVENMVEDVLKGFAFLLSEDFSPRR